MLAINNFAFETLYGKKPYEISIRMSRHEGGFGSFGTAMYSAEEFMGYSPDYDIMVEPDIANVRNILTIGKTAGQADLVDDMVTYCDANQDIYEPATVLQEDILTNSYLRENASTAVSRLEEKFADKYKFASNENKHIVWRIKNAEQLFELNPSTNKGTTDAVRECLFDRMQSKRRNEHIVVTCDWFDFSLMRYECEFDRVYPVVEVTKDDRRDAIECKLAAMYRPCLDKDCKRLVTSAQIGRKLGNTRVIESMRIIEAMGLPCATHNAQRWDSAAQYYQEITSAVAHTFNWRL